MMTVRTVPVTLLLVAMMLPGPSALAEVEYRVPIVDYGDDYVWYGNPPQYRMAAEGPHRVERLGIDVDGDGQADDSVAYAPFSMEKPLNPLLASYNREGNNARYYGGYVSYFANMKPYVPEAGINIDHEMREDLNLHSYATEGKGQAVRTFGLWLWRKQDFINGAADFPVSFDEQARLAVYITRYWKDYTEGRFVVREGDQFYISEATFGGERHRLYIVKPGETRWARYTPAAPHDIGFNATRARFEAVRFSDVTAVGWYIAHPELKPAALWVKWSAFMAEGVVRRPATPSFHLKMTAFGDRCWVADQEVTFKQWHTVYEWAVRNQYALVPGYGFAGDGDMGKMDRLDGRHSAEEPVTDVTLLDAMAWCNALSEREGKRPVYYVDADHTRVFRHVRNRLHPARYGERPTIRADWSAEGYRLPTPTELATAVGTTVAPGGPGCLLWPVSGHTLAGNQTQRIAAGNVPQRGGWQAVTFRPVRGNGTAPAEEVDTAMSLWRFDADAQQAEPPPLETGIEMPMVTIPAGSFTRRDQAEVSIAGLRMGKTEVTFRQWQQVYRWAVRNGYHIDRDGDMGSMDWQVGRHSHGPDEPVTDVGYHDALAWCNALSEMKGLTPVYYSDDGKTEVYREALRFRARMAERSFTPYGTAGVVTHRVHMKWDADGFRLPTVDEWEYAARAGYQGEGLPWPDAKVDEHAWIAPDADGTTHPVGTKQANAFGLHDMVGNVFEWCWGGAVDYYDRNNPRGDGRPAARGGSFRLSHVGREGRVLAIGARSASGWNLKWGTSWPELGFRVARHEAGTHPAEAPPYVPQVVLDVEPDDIDSLQGRTVRGNQERTGVYPGPCPNANLAVAWRYATESQTRNSVIVVDGLAYLGGEDGRLHAVRSTDGAAVWIAELGPPIRTTPTVSGDDLFVVAGGRMHALNRRTGEVQWTAANLATSRNGGIAVAAGVVFGNINWSTLVGFDVATGREVWRHRDRNGLGHGRSAPAILGTTLIWCNGSPCIEAADLRTERLIWRYNANADSWQQTPAIFQDRVYFAAGQGVIAVDAKHGREAWRFSQAHWDTRHPRFSSPAVDTRSVYIGNIDGHLYALDRQTGDLRWKFLVGQPVIGSPIVAEGMVVFGADDHRIRVVDAETAEARASIQLDGRVRSSPTLQAGRLYVATEVGSIYCIESDR